MSVEPDSPVGGDGVETGAGSAAPGLTGSLPDASDREPGTGRLDDLRALLAVTIAHPKMPADIRRYAGGDECDVCVRALDAADAVLEAGFVRVSVDDDTAAEIRALKKTLEASRGHARGARQQGLDRETCRFWQGVSGFLRSRIRALEAGEEPDWPDAANSIRADLGSCVRCGVRDAADGEQLCDQCDRELEVEVAQDRAAVQALRGDE